MANDFFLFLGPLWARATPFVVDILDPDAVKSALMLVVAAGGAIMFVAGKNPLEEWLKLSYLFLSSLFVSYLHKCHERRWSRLRHPDSRPETTLPLQDMHPPPVGLYI
jgi:hypothetical protein